MSDQQGAEEIAARIIKVLDIPWANEETITAEIRPLVDENKNLMRNWRNEQDLLSAEQIKSAEVEEHLRVAEARLLEINKASGGRF